MIDTEFLLYFIIGAIGGCSAMGGFALCKFAEYEQEIRRLRRRLNDAEDDWLHRERLKAWQRDEF